MPIVHRFSKPTANSRLTIDSWWFPLRGFTILQPLSRMEVAKAVGVARQRMCCRECLRVFGYLRFRSFR